MNQMVSSTNFNPELFLKAGINFSSFDKLKNAGQQVLEPVQKGVFAQLDTKLGQYVILHHSDFQKLYGLAQDVHRLSSGLTLILNAVRSVQVHQGDESSMMTLISAAQMIGKIPVLPTQVGHGIAQPEGLDIEDDGSLDLTIPSHRPL
jgi:hypothetical protein